MHILTIGHPALAREIDQRSYGAHEVDPASGVADARVRMQFVNAVVADLTYPKLLEALGPELVKWGKPVVVLTNGNGEQESFKPLKGLNVRFVLKPFEIVDLGRALDPHARTQLLVPKKATRALKESATRGRPKGSMGKDTKGKFLQVRVDNDEHATVQENADRCKFARGNVSQYVKRKLGLV